MADELTRDELLNVGRQRLKTFQRRRSLNQQRRYSVDQTIAEEDAMPSASASSTLLEGRQKYSTPSRIAIRRSNSLKHSRSSSYGPSLLLSPTLTVSSTSSNHLTTVQEDSQLHCRHAAGEISLPSPPADPRPQFFLSTSKNVVFDTAEESTSYPEDSVPVPSSRHTSPRQSPRADRRSFLQQLESQFPVTVASHTEADLTGMTHSNLEESLIWIRQNARLSNERQQILEQLEKERAENERIQHELDELRQLHLATQRSWSRINEDLHSQLRLITNQKHALVLEGCKDSKDVLLSELDQLRQDLDQRDDLISQLFDRHVGLTDSETSMQDCEASQESPVTASEDERKQAKGLREERDAWKQVARNLEMRIVELSSRSGNDQ
ncbi:hypothetical protein NQZ79_g8267 [Umbelopsis isabellina]|nr:hypothetical protein NQZ79_g8267 [Umbelopsis isabellina]